MTQSNKNTNVQPAAAMNTSSGTLVLAQGALLVALLAVSAQVVVPLGPVPFTLQTAVLCLVALLMKPKESALVVGGYLLLGALGLPVFSAARGGLAMIMGPTGGFLYGFLVAAVLASAARLALAGKPDAPRSTGREWAGDLICAELIILIPYAFGVVHLMLVGHMQFGAALAVGVAPFVVVDLAKVGLAIVVAKALRKALGARL